MTPRSEEGSEHVGFGPRPPRPDPDVVVSSPLDRVLASSMHGRGRELWFPGFVLLVGLFQTSSSSGPISWAAEVIIVGAVVAALVLVRRAVAVALAVCWATGVFQVLTLSRFQFVELSLVVVAYGSARWGNRVELWLSGASVVAAPVVAALLGVVFGRVIPLVGNGYGPLLGNGAISDRLLIALGPVAVGGVLLGIPWIAGLAVRSTARAQASDRSRVQAEADTARAAVATGEAREIARLREEQARLARDVHDVVGHSLAVILAQAESGQYLPDSDPARLKQTLATIATSARSSLQDVRQVLGDTRGRRLAGGLDEVVEGVRASGHPVRSSVVGPPVPLPPDLEAVAYRVLQEMLTNALKHGDRSEPIEVERHWPSGDFDRDLRLEVRSVDAVTASPAPTSALPGEATVALHQPTTHLTTHPTSQPTEVLRAHPVAEAGGRSAEAPDAPDAPGNGLEGMRRRLESVGGRLDVRRREDGERSTFTVTAWVPVRAT